MNRSEFEAFYTKLFSADGDHKFLDHLFRTFDFNNDGKNALQFCPQYRFDSANTF